MKIKIIVTSVIIPIILVSCAPAAIVVPTETAIPTSTITPIPPTPTITPTSAPEKIADSKDLLIWVDEFVHAYDGTVVINDVEMDANKLTVELRENGGKYIESKKINGAEIFFLVVNEIPLAMREGNGQWQEATMGKLGDQVGINFTFQNDPNNLAQQKEALKKMCGDVCGIVIAGHLQINSVFRDFSKSDWQQVLTDWNIIQKYFDGGKIPAGYPYYWDDANNSMAEYEGIVDNPQFRGTSLLWPTIDNLSSNGYIQQDGATKQIFDLSLSPEENLKLLEFIIRTRVIYYPNIDRWDVSDEVMAGYVSNDPNLRAWNTLTGLTPAELITKIATWVKHDNPNAETIVNEHGVFNYNNSWTKPTHDGTMDLLNKLSQNHAQVDGFIDQNNLWIGIGINEQLMSKDIDKINALGFKISDSETMISIGDKAIDGNTKKVQSVEGNSDEEKQANMYRQLFKLYISKGIKTFGFGGVGDANAWTNFDSPNANPLLFDNEYRAKQAYYAIVQVLYEQIP